MLVKNWMTREVVTVDAGASMFEGIRLIKENDIHALPVLDNGKLVGIVTDRDLKRASASDATTLDIHELHYLLDKIKIRELMTKNPITVYADLTIEETAELLLAKKISGVPVVDHKGGLVGVITKTDLFRVIIALTGVGKRGIQFALQIKDSPGSIKAVEDIIRAYGGRIVSILTTYNRVPDGFRRIYIRMYGVQRERLQGLIEELKNDFRLIYMVDHLENRRQVFSVLNFLQETESLLAEMVSEAD
jgi:acetoin utilization protein AcuB